MIRSIFLPTLLLLFLFGCESQKTKPPYFSDTPITSPVLFSNEIKTSNGIAFSPDGNRLYISQQKKDTFQNGRTAAGIFEYKFVEDQWTGPLQIEIPGLMDAYHPVLSKDGQKLFFNSRSHPDSAATAYLFHDIWFIKRKNEGWTDPVNIETVNTRYYESYPSIAANGNLYFNSDRPGGKGGMDFYMSKFENGRYQSPIHLSAISSTDSENDLVIDPEERFIIFNRYIASDNSIDLWISYNQNETWSTPRKLPLVNENDSWELTPSLSPDSKYFFYEKNGHIWQIDTKILLNN